MQNPSKSRVKPGKFLAKHGKPLAAFFLMTSTAQAQVVNDYPTEARADYVFGCMAVNGQTRQALTKCSCSVDVIASILPYDQYVEAETVLSISRLRSERTAVLRNAPGAKNAVVDLRRAQAEAEIRCF
jgi:hypothetical protein